MNADDITRLRDGAKEWLAKYTSPESRALARRCIDGTATVEDYLSFIQDELREAMQVLPPLAPDNGRGGKYGDPEHAGNCTLRAFVELTQLRKVLTERARGEVAWLIERHDATDRPMWWCGFDPNSRFANTWSYESLDAVRFAREVDATTVARSLPSPSGIALEHMWLGPKESK